MTLAARCPSCKTAFKIPDAILQKQNGLVRCANCSHVFNAYEHAIDLSKVIKTVRKPKPNSNPGGAPISLTSAEDAAIDGEKDNNYSQASRQSKLAQIQQSFEGAKASLGEAIDYQQNINSKINPNIPENKFSQEADALKKALSQLNQSQAYQETQHLQNKVEDLHEEPNTESEPKTEENPKLKPQHETELKNQNQSTTPFKPQPQPQPLQSTESLKPSLDDNFDIKKTNGVTQNALEIDQKVTQISQTIENLGERFAHKVSGLIYGIENLFARKKKEYQSQKNLDLVLDSWQKEQKKRNRNLLLLSIFFIVLLIGTIFWQRNQIITNVPSTFPFFTKICQQFKCEIKPLEMSNNPIISYSDMQKDMSLASNRYIMNIGLKNKENLPAAMPFLEISLFDLNEQMIARRIFHPQEFLKSEDWQRVEKSGMSSEEELPIKIRFQIQQAVSSFKVTAFYQ